MIYEKILLRSIYFYFQMNHNYQQTVYCSSKNASQFNESNSSTVKLRKFYLISFKQYHLNEIS